MGKLPQVHDINQRRSRYNNGNDSHIPIVKCENEDAAICDSESCCSRPYTSGSLLDQKHNQLLHHVDVSDDDEVLLKTTSRSSGATRTRTHATDHDSTAQTDEEEKQQQQQQEEQQQQHDDDDIKELLVIGAGPHSLTLMLRLLEPDPDLSSDSDRHRTAEYTKYMRPISDVHRHVQKLARGPCATLKCRKSKMKSKSKSKAKTNAKTATKPKKNKKNGTSSGSGHGHGHENIPPPLQLKDVQKKVMVVDAHGDWLASWKQNFQAIGIKQLRSLMNAHADPYDHRAMEYYAEAHGRGEELVTLKDLSQRDKTFKGPYQVPTTSLFHDFHDVLVKAYGIEDMVQRGMVESITPMQSDTQSDEPVFEVRIKNFTTTTASTTTIVRTKRVVCAMGPNFSTNKALWYDDFLKSNMHRNYPRDRILQANEIVPWLHKVSSSPSASSPSLQEDKENLPQHQRLLIVGGGITSAQLTLLASKSSWCSGVTMIQRSKSLSRHFDVENKWMGPGRGKLLSDFWSLNMQSRFMKLRDARGGGSMPPEVLRELHRRADQGQGHDVDSSSDTNTFCVKEEVEISHVDWNGEQFDVTLDDGDDTVTEQYDMIWLATGSENNLDKYAALKDLRETLPLDAVNGLPVLSQGLTWSSGGEADNANGEGTGTGSSESKWMQTARQRFWCMGVLAGLQLGPDALNLVGARQGAVRVAKAIRQDMSACGTCIE